MKILAKVQADSVAILNNENKKIAEAVKDLNQENSE